MHKTVLMELPKAVVNPDEANQLMSMIWMEHSFAHGNLPKKYIFIISCHTIENIGQLI